MPLRPPAIPPVVSPKPASPHPPVCPAFLAYPYPLTVLPACLPTRTPACMLSPSVCSVLSARLPFLYPACPAFLAYTVSLGCPSRIAVLHSSLHLVYLSPPHCLSHFRHPTLFSQLVAFPPDPTYQLTLSTRSVFPFPFCLAFATCNFIRVSISRPKLTLAAVPRARTVRERRQQGTERRRCSRREVPKSLETARSICWGEGGGGQGEGEEI